MKLILQNIDQNKEYVHYLNVQLNLKIRASKKCNDSYNSPKTTKMAALVTVHMAAATFYVLRLTLKAGRRRKAKRHLALSPWLLYTL